MSLPFTPPPAGGCCASCGGFADGSIPQITLVVSGITNCSGICYTGDYKITVAGFNGTFLLTFDPVNNLYSHKIANAGTTTSYTSSDGSCTGTATPTSIDLYFTVQCFYNALSRFTEYEVSIGFSLGTSEVFGALFQLGLKTGANDNDSCVGGGGGTPASGGYGGTATFSAGP